MAMKKNLIRVSISLLIYMVAMAPLLHSSRSYCGTKPAENNPAPIQVRFVKGLGTDGDKQSVREVPTGPDPLHHHGNPEKP